MTKGNSLWLSIVCALLFVLVPILSSAFEFDFVRATDTTACINFRASDDEVWGYVERGAITQRSAERFCRTYYPTAVTGAMLTSGYACRAYGYMYNATIDCPDNSAPLDNCTVGGHLSSYKSDNYYTYGAGIECILDPRWSFSSTFTTDATYLTANGGAHGTQINRTITLSPSIDIAGIRPDKSMPGGTICLPPNNTAWSLAGSNIAKALCRTAGIPASTNSTISEGSNASSGYQSYFSNIQCSNSSYATLWNKDCSSTSHFYDAPTTNCSTQLPILSCPISFDMRLSDPIVSSRSDNGFQMIQLRQSGSASTAYDGIMCLDYYGYRAGFANAICGELYGDDVDFAAWYTSYLSFSLPSGTKEYLSAVKCSSYTDTNISKCTATLTPANLQYPCSYNIGVVSCKINHHNIAFSVSKDSESSGVYNPGKGHLLAAIPAVNQRAAAVCSDGFDQTAVFAACRTLGFNPGPNATFSVSPAISSHTINNVTCPPNANNLTDCKLQYSGTGYKIPYSTRQVCSGRVNLDCDIGLPQVEFRTSYSYLQARLYPNTEWGWVNVESGVTSKEGYFAMCQYATSTTGGWLNITRSFLTVSYCPAWASSYTDCTFEYTNIPSSYDFYCTYYSPSSKVAAPGSSDSSTGLTAGGIVGIAIGVPVFALVVIFFTVYCIRACLNQNDQNDRNASAAQAAETRAARNDDVEMAVVPADTNTPTDTSIYGQPVMGTAFPGLEGAGSVDAQNHIAVGVTSDNLPGRPYGIGAYQ